MKEGKYILCLKGISVYSGGLVFLVHDDQAAEQPELRIHGSSDLDDFFSFEPQAVQCELVRDHGDQDVPGIKLDVFKQLTSLLLVGVVQELPAQIPDWGMIFIYSKEVCH